VTERIKFTVFRDTWLRGAGDGLLLDSNGKRCCLGFLGQQLGCSDGALVDTAMPQGLEGGEADKFPASLVGTSATGYPAATKICNDIASLNDEVDAKDREPRLTELFAKADIDVEFRDSADEQATEAPST
jgi:hypothetical protein